MNKHIGITPSGMDCQMYCCIVFTNLMLLGTVRRKQAFYVLQ